MNEWNRLFFDLVVALAPTMPQQPRGVCHLAADLADAALLERRTRRAVRRLQSADTLSEVTP